MLVFETSRLLVRPYKEQDFDSYYQLHVKSEVRQYISSYKLSDNEIREKFNKQIITANKLGVWAMEAKETGLLIGLCKVVHHLQTTYEVGYALDPEFWRKGFGSEIAEGLVNYSFTQLELKKLIAFADERNVGSVKILESVGFCLDKEVWDNEEKTNVLHFVLAAKG